MTICRHFVLQDSNCKLPLGHKGAHEDNMHNLLCEKCNREHLFGGCDVIRLDPLDDVYSKVELVDHMGSDLSVINAARVSYDKESEWDTEELNNHWAIKLKEKDEKLISYLARNGHWTPFAHPQIQLRIKMPLAIARQWFKHISGLHRTDDVDLRLIWEDYVDPIRNEVSRRYVDAEPDLYVPREYRARPKAGQSKQGSSSVLHTSNDIEATFAAAVDSAEDAYEGLLLDEVAPEMARLVLPEATYTEFLETGSLYAYARIYKLRTSSNAQHEVRQYAYAVGQIIATLFPVSWRELTV